MKTKTKTKKRNPSDLTKRNNDARKREIEQLADKAAKMDRYFTSLCWCLNVLIYNVEQRVTKLEKGK